jgi:DNA helicase IV
MPMLTLSKQGATAEQLPIISSTRIGVEVIRGAAGSGKTTTALLRLESLGYMFEARQGRLETTEPIRVLVLTFNRTLAGYVEDLAREQLTGFKNISYTVETFSAWARQHLNFPLIMDDETRRNYLVRNSSGISLPSDFLLNEIDYICGRFQRSNFNDYLTTERTGRGNFPQVANQTRKKILELIENYYNWLENFHETSYVDWNSLAERMLAIKSLQYDIVVIDEAQDFSANQLRVVNHHLANHHCVTLVMDTAQRLYPRGFTWIETGLNMTNARFHRLKANHRNTIEIANFASGILKGLQIDDDGTIPDLKAATRHGPLPIVCRGIYPDQINFAFDWIEKNVDLNRETVAFLKPRGKGWFKTLRIALYSRGIPYVELTQNRDWPQGNENIALSTMHSSKGLEFDHVIILGLSSENMPCDQADDADEHDETQSQQRLFAMAIARARKTVMIGYKTSEASNLVRLFKSGTFESCDI